MAATGQQQLVDNARLAYQTLMESEHPLVVARVRDLADSGE